MKVLTIIPARANSERIRGKNWRPLGGKPLAEYAMFAALGSATPMDVLVSSDSPEVLASAAKVPGMMAVRRPDKLCTATSPAISYVHHALTWMQGKGKGPYEVVVIVQPTSPFTLGGDIDNTIALLSDPAADSAASIMEIPHDLNPLKLKTLDSTGLLQPYFEAEEGRMAAHELPRVYVRNGAVYVSRLDTIKSGKIIGDNCRGYLMPRERSLDLNDEYDWHLAEFMLAKKNDHERNS